MISVRHYIDSLISEGKVDNQNHCVLFEKAGYIPIALPRADPWQEVHAWAMEHIGYDNYNWTGNVFWFMNERDAMLFALRWA